MAHDTYLKSETTDQRVARLNYKWNPPTSSAHIYIWDWSDENPTKLVQTRVPNIYDARLNVWDVCRYFDFGEQGLGRTHDGYDTDDNDDLELPKFNPCESLWSSPEAIAKEVDTVVAARLSQPLSEATAVQPELNLLESQPVDVPWYLPILYGFLWPLPYPTHNIATDMPLWESTIKNVGLRSTTALHLTMSAAILTFLQGLRSKKQENEPSDALL